MRSIARLSILLAVILLSRCSQPEEAPFRGDAPEEAYLEGSEYPYFGSEEEWEQGFFTDRFKTLAKRWGQRQMLAIVRGNPEEAIRHAEQLLAADPGEQESLFNLARTPNSVASIRPWKRSAARKTPGCLSSGSWRVQETC